ncbi:unnamed protein product, partial [Cladocopium goreaui]
MFEPMLETISGWLTHVAESVLSLQEPNEPLQSQETLTKEGMEGLLSSLKFPLSYGHQEFKEHWPHTPHEAKLVIQSLHDLARALFGAREDDAVVASFLEKRGLSLLVEALLAKSTPEIIRAQAWQSLCLILLNVEEDVFQRLIIGRELDVLWSGEPDLRIEENRMNFVSCLKTVSMRIDVETLPFLMTDSDIPILRVAMAYTAHEEALLRTQARNAMLTLFSKMKMGEEQLLRTALEMAKSRLPTPLCTLLWQNWANMAQAAKNRNAPALQKWAFREEDLWDHLAELIKLDITDVTQMVCGVIVGSLVWKLGSLTPTDVGVNHWSAPFVNSDDFDSEPMMAVPPPGAWNLSPKSHTESTASLSADQSSLEECASFTACGLGTAMKVAETFAIDMASSEHCAAMALRTLATYAGTLRHAGIACALMPLVELILLPSIPSGSIRAMADLDAGCITEDLLALTEHFVAGAMEDSKFVARNHEDGTPPTHEEEEAMKKNRVEYWQGMLHGAHSMVPGRDTVPNPFRAAILAKMGFSRDGILPAQALSGQTSNPPMYPDLLEHTKLLAHSAPVDPVIEEPTQLPASETVPGTFAEAFAWWEAMAAASCHC